MELNANSLIFVPETPGHITQMEGILFLRDIEYLDYVACSRYFLIFFYNYYNSDEA